MSEYIYTIPALPPSNNEFMGRAAQWKYQEVKKKWEALVKTCCKPVPDKPIQKTQVTLNYYFPDNRRRDPDNYSGKMILDGLVRAGILVDDSFHCVDLFLVWKGVDRTNPRTEIVIKEINNVQ